MIDVLGMIVGACFLLIDERERSTIIQHEEKLIETLARKVGKESQKSQGSISAIDYLAGSLSVSFNVSFNVSLNLGYQLSCWFLKCVLKFALKYALKSRLSITSLVP